MSTLDYTPNEKQPFGLYSSRADAKFAPPAACVPCFARQMSTERPWQRRSPVVAPKFQDQDAVDGTMTEHDRFYENDELPNSRMLDFAVYTTLDSHRSKIIWRFLYSHGGIPKMEGLEWEIPVKWMIFKEGFLTAIGCKVGSLGSKFQPWVRIGGFRSHGGTPIVVIHLEVDFLL